MRRVNGTGQRCQGTEALGTVGNHSRSQSGSWNQGLPGMKNAATTATRTGKKSSGFSLHLPFRLPLVPPTGETELESSRQGAQESKCAGLSFPGHREGLRMDLGRGDGK